MNDIKALIGKFLLENQQGFNMFFDLIKKTSLTPEDLELKKSLTDPLLDKSTKEKNFLGLVERFFLLCVERKSDEMLFFIIGILNRFGDINHSYLFNILNELSLSEKNKELTSAPFNVNKTETINENKDKSSARFSFKLYRSRKSQFKGVSKNGTKWQIFISKNNKKYYYGGFSSQDEAARAYDNLALFIKKDKARLNFDYSAEEIREMKGSLKFDK